MEKDSKYLIEECRHCGNKTKLNVLGHYREVSNDYTDIQYTIDWYLLKCCVCEQVSFASIYSGEDTQFMNFNGEIDYEEVYETKYPVETYQDIKAKLCERGRNPRQSISASANLFFQVQINNPNS